MLNIDGCRVGHRGAQSYTVKRWKSGATLNREGGTWRRQDADASEVHGTLPPGRWPTNVVLDEHAAAELDAQSGPRSAGGNLTGSEPPRPFKDVYGEMTGSRTWQSYGDDGGASRFFPVFRYAAKAGADERPSGEVTIPP